MALISVIILTLDEEANLPHALKSLEGLDCEVHVVDSGSRDRTVEIARAAGANVVTHAFESQARQLNRALDTLPITAPWTLRLDADERLSDELKAEITALLPSAPDLVAAYMMKRRVYFWGRWIRFGGYYPTWLVRLWRTGKARSEDAWMDEHMVVADGGHIAKLSHDLIDENHKGLAFWIDKHNRYADREVKLAVAGLGAQDADRVGSEIARRRRLKRSIYGRAPLFVRAVGYWLLRYFVLLGFLDGRAGFVFHFMQGLWYRLLVDAKLFELKLRERQQ